MSVNPLPSSRLERGLDTIWYVACAPQVLIVLVVLLAITLAFAAIFPQLPTGLDASVADRWLATTVTSYGGAGAFLRGIGAFNIVSSPWTLALLAALAFHLSLRAAGQIAHLLHRRSHRREGSVPTPPPGLPFEAARIPLSLPEAAGSARQVLRAWAGALTDQEAAGDDSTSVRRVRVPMIQDEHHAGLYAERRPWGALGPLLGYLGPLIIIAGLLLDGVNGWRAGDIALAPGETASPPQAQGLGVTLSATGEGVAQLTLTRDAATQSIFVATGAPGRWGNVWAAERTTGPALTVQVRTPDGKPVPVQALNAANGTRDVLRLRFEQADSEQAFVIPSENLILRAVSYAALPDRGIDRPVFFVEGYRGDDPTPGLSELVEDAAVVEWEGVTLSFRRDRFVVVDLAALPGLPWLAVGALMTLISALLTLWLGNVRAWVDVTEGPEGAVIAARTAGPGLPQVAAARLMALIAPPAPAEQRARLSLNLLTVAGMLFMAALLTAGAAIFAIRPEARGWAFLIRNVLAGLGLGAALPAFIASALFARRHWRLMADGRSVTPELPQRGRPVDWGRLPVLIGFPFLTAALISAAVWNLQTYAVAWRTDPSDLWLLVAWLLGAAYLHTTSSWRPLGLPAGFATLIAAAALGASALAVLTTGQLLW